MQYSLSYCAESVPDFWGGTESMNCLISAYITTIGSSTAAVNEPSVLFMFVNNQSAALIWGWNPGLLAQSVVIVTVYCIVIIGQLAPLQGYNTI